MKSLSRKYREKVHIKKSEGLLIISTYTHFSFLFLFPQFLSKITKIFFQCFWKFIKQLHKHCLFIQIHSSTMVKWVFSGLRETTSTDVFHHCYSTRNVIRKEGSVATEFLLLGHPGCVTTQGIYREFPDNTWRTTWLAPELQRNSSALS